MRSRPPRDLIGLAAIFAASGVLHFARPRPYEQMVPRALPRRRELVYASGVAELVCAAGLLHPKTRSGAGLASAVLLVAVFPANVQMTLDVCRSRRRGPTVKAVVLARLPLQVPMIRIAWKAFRQG